MMKFTEEENNEMRALAEEIRTAPTLTASWRAYLKYKLGYVRPDAEKTLLEIIKQSPRMIKAMEKEIAQTGGSSHN